MSEILKNHGQKTLRAYGYCRVSTKKQADDGLSLQAQEQDIRAWAQYKGVELVEVIHDDGSGKDLNRPGLQRLLKIVGNKESEFLVVCKLDRLSRNVREILYLVEDVFSEGGTHLVSLREEINTTTPMGRFFLMIMSALAQMEREQTVERIEAVMEYKKDKGDHMGKIPYGYRRENGRLISEEQEKKALKSMRKMREKGNSYNKIAESLNKKGIPTRKRGGKWHASTVRTILTRKRFTKFYEEK